MFFWWWPVICKEFLLKRCAVFFSLSHRHAVLQGATSDLQRLLVLEFILQKSCNWAAECFFRKNGNSFCPRLSHEEALWCIMSTPTTVSAQRLWRSFWSLTACLHFWRPNPVTWRSMCMWRKLTSMLLPPLPDPFKNECFQKRARLLARFFPLLAETS